MCADVFTKPFLVDCKWTHARLLIGCFVPSEVWSRGVSCFTPPPSPKTAISVPAPIVDRNWKYTVIEFCCDEDSSIGRSSPTEKGCRVIRITRSDDALSKNGMKKFLDACRTAPMPILFGAIPCTGGSPWQRINALRGAGDKIEGHQKLARRLWDVFAKGAKIAKTRGGFPILRVAGGLPVLGMGMCS